MRGMTKGKSRKKETKNVQFWVGMCEPIFYLVKTIVSRCTAQTHNSQLVFFFFFFFFGTSTFCFVQRNQQLMVLFWVILPVFGGSLLLVHQINTRLNSNIKVSPVSHYTLHCYNAMQIPKNQVFSSLSSIAHWGVQSSVGASTG